MKSLSLKTNLSFANNDTLCQHLPSKQFSNLALWQSNIRFIVWSGALLKWTKYHLLKSSGGVPTLSLKSSCCPKANLISILPSKQKKKKKTLISRIKSLLYVVDFIEICRARFSLSEHTVLKLLLKNPWELRLHSQFLILSLSVTLLSLFPPWHRTN